MRRVVRRLSALPAALLACVVAHAMIGAGPAEPGDDRRSRDEERVDARWLDRLDEGDRALVDANIGFAPPAIPADIVWHKGEAQSWAGLRGKVIVIQSWTSETPAGRAAIDRAIDALREADGTGEIVIVGLHTPEGAKDAAEFLKRRDPGVPVIIDSSGGFCDEFGFYKKPANVVVDRNGVVRFAGLSALGLREAARRLVKQEADPGVNPKPRETAGVDEVNAEFPPHHTGRISANNVQGKPAPDLYVQHWVTQRPADAKGKVVIVDFWATWCGPCVDSIPHMNDLAAKFRGDVVVIGLSNEYPGTIQEFLRSHRMDYHVGADPTSRMIEAIQVKGIPHVMVVSSDWVVRWQGHPGDLDAQILQKIVAANRAFAGSGDGSRYRWTRARRG